MSVNSKILIRLGHSLLLVWFIQLVPNRVTALLLLALGLFRIHLMMASHLALSAGKLFVCSKDNRRCIPYTFSNTLYPLLGADAARRIWSSFGGFSGPFSSIKFTSRNLNDFIQVVEIAWDYEKSVRNSVISIELPVLVEKVPCQLVWRWRTRWTT